MLRSSLNKASQAARKDRNIYTLHVNQTVIAGACYHSKQTLLDWIQRQTALTCWLFHDESINH